MKIVKQFNPSFFDQNSQSILQTLILVNSNPHRLLDTLIFQFSFFMKQQFAHQLVDLMKQQFAQQLLDLLKQQFAHQLVYLMK